MAKSIITAEVPVLRLVVPTVVLFMSLAVARAVISHIGTSLPPISWLVLAIGGLGFALTITAIEGIAIAKGTVALIRAPSNRSISNMAAVVFGGVGLAASVFMAIWMVAVALWVTIE